MDFLGGLVVVILGKVEHFLLMPKEPLTAKKIEVYLNSDKLGKGMSTQIGAYMVSIAIFSLTVLVLVAPIEMNKSINVFWSLCIIFLTGIGSFAGLSIAYFKYDFFRKISSFISVIMVIISGVFAVYG